jgi:hypothetical protein
MRVGCANADLEPKPRWTHPRIDSDSRDACFTLSSASVRNFSRVRRVRRLGLGPRSLPVDLTIDPAFRPVEELVWDQQWSPIDFSSL